MKRYFKILLFLFLSFSYGEVFAQDENKLDIGFGRNFRKERVKVYIDDALVLNLKISTPKSNSGGNSLSITRPEKAYTITVEVNDIKTTQKINISKGEKGWEFYDVIIEFDRRLKRIHIGEIYFEISDGKNDDEYH